MESNDVRGDAWLLLRDASVVRRGVVLLKCVDFKIRRGEFHVLIGEQGGGKTILCDVLRGEMELASGELILDSLPCGRYNRGVARKIGVESAGYLPQVFPHQTIAENIAISLCRRPNRHWFGKLPLFRKVAEWLEEQGIRDLPLEVPLEKYPLPEHLFIQVLATLFTGPRLIVMDETLENLPVYRREQIMAVLKRMIAEGMTVLWATQQLEDGWRLADRLTIIRHGKILLTDSPGNIDRRSLLRLAYAQVPDTEQDERDRERFFNLVLYTEALLKDLPLAIVIVDNQGTLQFVNRVGRSMLPGFDAATIGTSSIFGLAGDGQVCPIRALAEVISGGVGCREHAVTFNGRDGEIIVDYQVQAVLDGTVGIGAMLIVHDVSERERLRSRLILSHNISSVGLLASGVAHDVNNPLAAIGNYLSFLMRKLPEGQLRDTARRAGDEAKNIQNIIDNLVGFSGNARKDQDCVDLHGLAVDLCTLLRFNATRSGIKLSVVPPPTGCETAMFADIKEMRQLLINLIRNAMEAMPGGGEVRVDFSSTTPERIVIQVIDNGPGIQFSRLEDVFEPFVSSKSQDDQYHGIGLTIVFNIVEKNSGTIEVANLAEGGCKFTLGFTPTPPAA